MSSIACLLLFDLFCDFKKDGHFTVQYILRFLLCISCNIKMQLYGNDVIVNKYMFPSDKDITYIQFDMT